MNYWIQYDANSKIVTNISKQAKNGWTIVYVDKLHDSFFNANFSSVKYDDNYGALVYPDNFHAEQQLSNNSNATYNSLVSSYDAGISSFRNVVNSVNQSFNSFQTSASSNNDSLVNSIGHVKTIAQIQRGVNYFNSDQSQKVKDYFLTNTPINVDKLLDGIPATDVPMSLLIKASSPKWQYIAPQLAGKTNIDINGNYIIISGQDANTLQQTLNTELAQNPNTVWAILHYGDSVTIEDAGLYYYDAPTGKTFEDVESEIAALKETISWLQIVAKNTSKGSTGTNYLTDSAKSEIINCILYGVNFNFMDIFQSIPNTGSKMQLSINVTSPSWNSIYPQLQKLSNVTTDGNNVIITGNNAVDLENNISQQLAQTGTNIWAILHYGDHVTISDASLTYV